MVWQKLKKEIGKPGESIYEYSEFYINDIPLERGGCRIYGEKHPFGWETFGKVEKYLWKEFKKVHISKRIADIKEKFGQLRIYTILEKKDITKYREVLAKAIKKFPGLADFLSPDHAEERVIFTGTEEEYEEWKDYKEASGNAF